MTPTTRALIAAARAGLDPDPGAAARVRAKLNVALAASPAAPIAAPAASGGLALKLAAFVVATGVVATVAAVASHRSRATAVPAPRIDEIAVVEAPAVRVHVVAPDSSGLAPESSGFAPESPHPAHARATRPVVMPAIHAPAAPAPAREVDLAREVELIDRAMASLRAGHPDDALAAITIYHRETADRGQLTEDATAIDIEASCTLHLDVTAKLAAFDHTWPSSAERSRLTTACGK